jgi:hypothetical protein
MLGWWSLENGSVCGKVHQGNEVWELFGDPGERGFVAQPIAFILADPRGRKEGIQARPPS